MSDFGLLGALHLAEMHTTNRFLDGLARNRANNQLMADYNGLVARFNALARDYERLDYNNRVLLQHAELAQTKAIQDAAKIANLEWENAQLRQEATQMKRAHEEQALDLRLATAGLAGVRQVLKEQFPERFEFAY